MRKSNRPRISFPPGSVEALEPRMFQRVTSHGARMEIDFWKSIIMPLQSGLVAEVSEICFFLATFEKVVKTEKIRKIGK